MLLENLPSDIYKLLDPDTDHECKEENLEELSENIKALLRDRLRKREEGASGALRFSALGKPDRQLWYEAHPEEGTKEKLLPKTYFKFLYGDIIEQLVLFLAREAGHVVEDTQKELEVDGVKGHIDAIIDGVLVDVKSASPFSYQKFYRKEIVGSDDPFGYVYQLSGYGNVLTPGKDTAWVAVDKVSGDICVSPLPAHVSVHYHPKDRIDHLKKVLSDDETLPPLCYEPIPDGKSGNLKLGVGCSYCPHKFRCYPSLRAFAYSTGPRFLCKVSREPEVPEIPREAFLGGQR